MAISHSPLCRLSQAILRAVNDEEHAVSTTKLGPVRFKQNDTLFAIIDNVLPVEEN